MSLSKLALNEIYDFIVGSNLESSLINQSNKNVRKELSKWLGVDDD